MLVRFFSTTTKRIKIPKAVREQVWLKYMGPTFSGDCQVTWCENTMNVFDFTVGHNKPLSKGGKNKIDNFIPICSRCNSCMGDRYTIDEWSERW